MTYHGPLINEKRDKPRLDSVKGIVANFLSLNVGKWVVVPKVHAVVSCYRSCREDTIRRMLNYLMKEGTETHTFESRPSTSIPGTSEYCARRRNT